MSYSIGDGMVTLALAGGIIGYLHLKHRARQQKLEIIHQERMAAMEKGIPLPEFPLEPAQVPREPDPTVLPILGIVLLTVSIGAMIVLYWNLELTVRGMWIAPLPIAFMGLGLIAFHLLKAKR